MIVSHSELESCRKGPVAWIAKMKQPRPFIQMGYEGYLKLGIYRYHKVNDASIASAHLKKLLKAAARRLTDLGRHEAVMEQLDRYVSWWLSSGSIWIGHRVRISFSVSGFLVLRGEVGRVDLTERGYRALLLGRVDRDWDNQLRFPLLQQAVAQVYARPVEEVEVGVQSLTDFSIQSRVFNARQRRMANEKFHRLEVQLRELE